MTIYFSSETRGFYTDAINGDAIPADAVEVSQDAYDALHAAQNCSAGTIVAGADGQPEFRLAEPASHAAMRGAFLQSVRTRREAILNRLAGVGFAALASGDTLAVQAIAVARADLLDITTCAGVAAAQVVPALQAAVCAELLRIASALPDEARRAFTDAGIPVSVSLPASGED